MSRRATRRPASVQRCERCGVSRAEHDAANPAACPRLTRQFLQASKGSDLEPIDRSARAPELRAQVTRLRFTTPR